MRIIICGAGRVGQGIAERLSVDNDVTVIDQDPKLVDVITNKYEVRGLVGHASDPNVLKLAQADITDMIIAVTYSDEVNMVTCQVAHSIFDVTTKIARIRRQDYFAPGYRKLFSAENLPVDMYISPEQEVGESILERLNTPGAFLTASFLNNKVKLLGVEISGSSQIVEATVGDVSRLLPGTDARILGIGRDNRVFAPQAEDIIHQNDRVYWMVPTGSVRHMFSVLGAEEERNRTVVIVGGGNIGLYVAQQLEKSGEYRVRVVEKDHKTAQRAAETLRKSIVILGDGLDPEILEEAGAGESSVVLGLTSDDKTNLLLGPLAKTRGARKVLALVNDTDLARIRSNLDIDIIVDPRSITVSKILLRLRQGRLTNLQSIEGSAAEVVEGVARETSEFIGMNLSEDDLPEGMTAGALMRGDELISLDHRVKPKDLVVMFAEKNMARRVDQFYRVKPEFY